MPTVPISPMSMMRARVELVRPLQKRRRQATEEAVVEAPAPAEAPIGVPAAAVRVLHKFSGYGDFEGSVVSMEADGACSVKWDADGSVTTLDQPRFERARRRYAEKHGLMPPPSSSGRAEEGRARHARAAGAGARPPGADAGADADDAEAVAPRGAATVVRGRGRPLRSARGQDWRKRLGDDSGAAGHGAVGERLRAEVAGPDELELDARAAAARAAARGDTIAGRADAAREEAREARGPAPAEEEAPTAARPYPVGTQVEARFKGGAKFYAAIVVAARDGAVDALHRDARATPRPTSRWTSPAAAAPQAHGGRRAPRAAAAQREASRPCRETSGGWVRRRGRRRVNGSSSSTAIPSKPDGRTRDAIVRRQKCVSEPA